MKYNLIRIEKKTVWENAKEQYKMLVFRVGFCHESNGDQLVELIRKLGRCIKVWYKG